jgi:hypothetical protein
VNSDEVATALVPPREVALFADGEQVSDWVPLHPDGSSGYMRLRESRTAQVWTIGISATPDGPLTQVEVWPGGVPRFNEGALKLSDDT